MDGSTASRRELPPHGSRSASAPTALNGTLVADFSRVVAGPVCTQLLADLGACVRDPGRRSNHRTLIRLFYTPTVAPVPAPTLGQHSRVVFADLLGYDAKRCAAFAAGGTFGKVHNEASERSSPWMMG